MFGEFQDFTGQVDSGLMVLSYCMNEVAILPAAFSIEVLHNAWVLQNCI